MKRVAVIGGGIGGLAAARALVKAGYDAQVFESRERPGGVISTTIADGFLHEHAASSFLGSAPRGARVLCQELGVPLDQASSRAKRRWIFLDGKLRALPRSPLDLIRSDLLTWRGKLDLLREPLRAPRVQGDESIYSFASRRFGAETARAIVAPFVTGIFAADAHEVSLEAGFPKLAELDAQGGIVRGTAASTAKQLFRRFAGGKAKKVARGLYAPQGGLAALTGALATVLGDRVHTKHPVAALAPDGSGVLVDGERWDAAVLAVPAQDAVGMVSALPELASRLAVFRRAPTQLVYLGYPAASVPVTDGFGFLVAQGEALRVLGVVFESVVWPDRAPPGHVLLRCIFGGGRDPGSVALSDDELVAHATRDVAKALGVTGAPIHAEVSRQSRGIAQYPVGHKDHVRHAAASARTHRIALAGADYRGPGVNDLCADADVIVDEVRSWI